MAITITQVEKTFPGTPSQIPQARAWTLAALPAGCVRRDDVALVVSELVTNAVLHSASGQIGGAFIVRIEVTEAAIQLSVSDQGPALVPARRTPDESGRGLDLVAALADAYDVIDAPIGRTVRCRLTAERR